MTLEAPAEDMSITTSGDRDGEPLIIAYPIPCTQPLAKIRVMTNFVTDDTRIPHAPPGLSSGEPLSSPASAHLHWTLYLQSIVTNNAQVDAITSQTVPMDSKMVHICTNAGKGASGLLMWKLAHTAEEAAQLAKATMKKRDGRVPMFKTSEINVRWTKLHREII